jgi:DNA-binding MarR family transcriptional regulator
MLRKSAVHRKRHDPLIPFWSGVHRFLWVRRQFAKGAGLSNNQYELLLAVKACEDKRPNIAFMADRLLLEHHVVASIARYLNAHQLLQVEPSHSDRRSLSLSLTPKGKRLLGDLVRRSVAALEVEGPGLLKALSDVLPPRRARFKSR